MKRELCKNVAHIGPAGAPATCTLPKRHPGDWHKAGYLRWSKEHGRCAECRVTGGHEEGCSHA